MKSLNETLIDFKQEANDNSSFPKILKKWNPNIIICSDNEDQIFTIEIRDQKIDTIHPGRRESNHEIEICADTDVLINVLSGKENPSEMVLDGLLQVFGSESDQIKLDAITLILWGM